MYIYIYIYDFASHSLLYPLRLSISLLSQYSFNDIIYLIIFPYITKKKISAFFPHICVHCDSV